MQHTRLSAAARRVGESNMFEANKASYLRQTYYAWLWENTSHFELALKISEVQLLQQPLHRGS